jgi:multiple antibiotic resistance protein
MSTLSAAFLLFLILDPLGNIPVFLTTLKAVDPARQRRVILRELLIALAIILFFLFLGQFLLQLLQVSSSSLRIAGGIILFLIAIRMIFSDIATVFGAPRQEEPFIVPLAVPLVAGPSAMTMLILLMAGDPSRWLDWLAATVLAWLCTCLILLSSYRLNRVLGTRGLIAVERLMGMLLVTVAIDMLIDGIKQTFFTG